MNNKSLFVDRDHWYFMNETTLKGENEEKVEDSARFTLYKKRLANGDALYLIYQYITTKGDVNNMFIGALMNDREGAIAYYVDLMSKFLTFDMHPQDDVVGKINEMREMVQQHIVENEESIDDETYKALYHGTYSVDRLLEITQENKIMVKREVEKFIKAHTLEIFYD